MKRLFLLSFLLFAFTVNSQDNLWEEVSKSHLKSKNKKERPSKYKVYKLDLQLLKEELKKVPKQRKNINTSTVILHFPDENGVLKEYQIAEASVMDTQLQENHPKIKSYIGISVDNSNSIIRFSISPYVGFNGIILYKIYFYITQIICIFPQKKMGRSTRKISGYSSSEIKALFKTEDKYKIGIRLYAVYQISLGKPSRELEVLYNTSFKQILNWASRFEKEGIEGLRDKKGRGRKSKLTDAQKEQLKEVVLKKSPENYGYNTSTWNGPLLIDWLNKHMGVFYQRAQIYNVLKSLGLTYQKSKGFYPEADKEKQSIFKETLKKTS